MFDLPDQVSHSTSQHVQHCHCKESEKNNGVFNKAVYKSYIPREIKNIYEVC